MSISLLVAHYYFGRFSIGVHLDQGFKKCFVEVYCLLVVFGFFCVILSNILFSITECQYLERKFFWETQNAAI